VTAYVVDRQGRVHWEEGLCDDCGFAANETHVRFPGLDEATQAQLYLRMVPCPECMPADDLEYFRRGQSGMTR
jgi:hypothetical protein